MSRLIKTELLPKTNILNDIISFNTAVNITGNVGIGTTNPSVALQVGHVATTTDTTLLVAAGYTNIATIAAYGQGQGTGRLYLGQDENYGGGIIYNGDDIPDTIGTRDTISFFRRDDGTDTEVMNYGFNDSTLNCLGSLNVTNWWMIYNSARTNYWQMYYNSDNNLVLAWNGVTKGFFDSSKNEYNIDFTGQHRSHNTNLDITKHLGLIVSSTGIYNNLNNSNIDIPTINESLPEIELSSTPYDKKVYGVISSKEEEGTTRKYELGTFVSVYDKTEGDNRIIINSLGEGGIWVCSINGNLENGDYITSSSIKGYGMRQNDDLLHNYTVAKITCDCDFNNIPVKFDKRYLNTNGDIITEEEYTSNIANNIPSYKAAFVGCTYHCG